MDNTPIYIKMADCPEIQEDHIFDTGDFAITEYDKKFGIFLNPGRGDYLIDLEGHDFYTDDFESLVWLPRQDDLQKMVVAKVCADYTKTDLSPEHRLVTVFASFVTAVRFPYKIPQNDLTSMEQLWLAFVMSELHSKTWDGKAWISA